MVHPMLEPWMPIETAPKDGTKIDAWRIEPPHEGGTRFIDVSWRDGAWQWYSDRDQEFIDLDEGNWKVTHWMPAPGPPTI